MLHLGASVSNRTMLVVVTEDPMVGKSALVRVTLAAVTKTSNQR